MAKRATITEVTAVRHLLDQRVGTVATAAYMARHYGYTRDDTIEVIDALRREYGVYNATTHVNAVFQLKAEGKPMMNGRRVIS